MKKFTNYSLEARSSEVNKKTGHNLWLIKVSERLSKKEGRDFIVNIAIDRRKENSVLCKIADKIVKDICSLFDTSIITIENKLIPKYNSLGHCVGAGYEILFDLVGKDFNQIEILGKVQHILYKHQW